MVQISDKKTFRDISPLELLEATALASQNFQIRAFFEAKEDILKTGKYSERKFYEILDSMMDAETERKLLLTQLRRFPFLLIEEILEKLDQFPKEKIIRDLIYLKEQGYIEEQVEKKTRLVKKTIKGEEKEVEEHEYFYRYRVKELLEDFKEHYLEPVSIIYDAGVCCHCGWCSSICPVDAIKVSADNLELDGDKCMKCGLCFSICPRSFPIGKLYEIMNKSKTNLNWSDKIGAYINTYSGSTKKEGIKQVCQDGGVVTSLLEYLLKEEIVDTVLTVQHSSELWRPEPVIIDSIEGLYKTAGTKYANSPSLNLVHKARDYGKIAIVGVPCMMKAIEKANYFPSNNPFFHNIELKIGLFCMESFSYENIIKLVEEQFSHKIDEITKMNIDKGKFIINLKSGEQKDVPLKEIQSYARHNCHFCDDLTSDYADISVGSIGSQSGWSSVITRTEKGEDIYNKAVKAGYIESKKLEDVKPGQFLVEKIAGIKRKKCKPIEIMEEN